MAARSRSSHQCCSASAGENLPIGSMRRASGKPHVVQISFLSIMPTRA